MDPVEDPLVSVRAGPRPSPPLDPPSPPPDPVVVSVNSRKLERVQGLNRPPSKTNHGSSISVLNQIATLSVRYLVFLVRIKT